MTTVFTKIIDMRLIGTADQPVTNELAVIARMLTLEGASILELGCGAAEKTRAIIETHEVANITAAEIDPIQHKKNLEIKDLPKVVFKSYGAESIPEPDASFDIVMMFKSLHHVPGPRMDDALMEIRRVLKPGGHVYISEPVFAGDFNEIMRLFHDEEIVRQNAFDALTRAVNNKVLDLQEEFFFKTIVKLKSFEQYEKGILSITHSQHNFGDETLAEVKRRFMANESDKGFIFEIPNRVDLLKKPA